MANRKDITGRQFGWLTVTRSLAARGPRGDVLWLLRCRCGKEITRRTSDLLRKPRREGEVRSCGCSAHDRIYAAKHGGVGELSGPRYGRLQAQARHRGHHFDVTAACLWERFVEQGGCCALTGVALTLSRRSARLGEAIASLDRIDSVLGYVLGNIQWVHPTINFMKHAMPQDHLIEWCRRVAAHKT